MNIEISGGPGVSTEQQKRQYIASPPLKQADSSRAKVGGGNPLQARFLVSQKLGIKIATAIYEMILADYAFTCCVLFRSPGLRPELNKIKTVLW